MSGAIMQGSMARQWNAAIAALVEQGWARHAAVRKISVERPELRRAYLREINKEHGHRHAVARLEPFPGK